MTPEVSSSPYISPPPVGYSIEAEGVKVTTQNSTAEALQLFKRVLGHLDRRKRGEAKLASPKGPTE